ncbi:hypothetical protein CLOM_g22996 [Closterium sp. NIES-68]|nr:hypothetical protein CLOM_g22996 [Closterium sp. NIES-68]GJP73371.1 hypothetical protein CLOP_g4094 [Closterium sp. NIES-67]GJP78517.1 hypothetical protein CLOP_g8811 [Closterium sp. NIES-67]
MGCLPSKEGTASVPVSKSSKSVPSLSTAKVSTADDGDESSSNIRFLTYDDIKRATDNFSNVLGEGGFGKVYKGRLRGVNGDDDEDVTFVAIKVLAPHSFQGIEEFLNEISSVESVQHPNIVKLLACCTEKVKALVYEYIPMGDVDALIAKCSEGKAKFSWADRMKVIMGTAEALTYIHRQRFIHRDFKASNVLLTEDFTPKVADFGLAKGIDDWKTHVTTRVKGSMGYIDPTYFESGHLCDKSDVFAFGLYLVEILAGKSVLRQGFAEDIKAWLYEADALSAEDMLDLSILNEANKREAHAIAIIAKQSTARDWADRPTMEEVLEVLKIAIKLPEAPRKDNESQENGSCMTAL